MKTLSTTLGVARSNVIERRDGNRSRRGPQERPGNVELAGAIRTLVDMRPSYGYRRIAALLQPGLPLGRSPRGELTNKRRGMCKYIPAVYERSGPAGLLCETH